MATSTSTGNTLKVSVAGYSHVNLMVDDLDAAIAFYTDVMGFELLPRPDFGEFAKGVWLGHGAAQIHLSVVDEMVPRKGFAPHIALHIPADVYAESMAALEARGVTFLGAPNRREDFGTPVWAAFIEDPCGNLIELTDVDPR